MKRGKIIMVCGLPGSGKSTLARKLKVKFNAVSFVPDEWMIKLFEYSNKPEDRDNIEKLQLELALDLADRGVDVILENGFWSASERLSLIKKTNSLNISIDAYFLMIDDSKRESRIYERNKSLDRYEYKMGQVEIEYCRGRFEKPEPSELKLYEKYQIRV